MILRATPQQQAIISDPSRVKVLVAGRGWGKDITIELLALKTALEYPNYCSEIICPRYSQTTKMREEMLRCPIISRVIARSPLQPYPRFIFRNGHCMGFRSFDHPENLRGERLVLAVINEAADIPFKQCQEIILPKLAGIDGKLFIAGSVKGSTNWLWQWYLKGQKTKNWSSWKYPSNTNLIRYGGAAGYQRLLDDRAVVSEDTWDQEYMCKPLASKELVFRYIHQCVLDRSEPAITSPRKGFYYIIGLDLGKTRDHAAWVVLEVDVESHVYRVVDSDQFERGTPYSIVATNTQQLSNKWNSATVVVDCTGGATGGKANYTEHIKVIRKHIKRIEEFYWGQNKLDVINDLALIMEQGRLQLYSKHTELIDQLASYVWIEKGNYLTCGAQSGAHDDYVACIAQAIYGARQGWLSNHSLGPISNIL